MNDLEIKRGDDVSFEMTFREEDGTAYDITGMTVFFTMKRKFSDADADALISKTVTSHSDPTAGETTVALSNSDTTVTPGKYPYDLQIKDGDGKIQSTSTAYITILPDVTQRTS